MFCKAQWQHYSGAPVLISCDRKAGKDGYCRMHGWAVRAEAAKAKAVVSVTFTQTEARYVRSALRLRAEASEENDDAANAKRWRSLLQKVGG